MTTDFDTRTKEVQKIHTAIVSAENNLMYSLNDINKIMDDISNGKLVPSSRLIYLTDFIRNSADALLHLMGQSVGENEKIIDFNTVKS